jgi:uncharacterized protein YvpB
MQGVHLGRRPVIAYVDAAALPLVRVNEQAIVFRRAPVHDQPRAVKRSPIAWRRGASVVAGLLLSLAVVPVGAVAAQLQPLRAHGMAAECSEPCAGAAIANDPVDAERNSLLAALAPGCSIRTACPQPAAPDTAIAVQYVEPPAPAVSGSQAFAGSGAVVVGVPVYSQIWALDCETAALQMALAYTGHFYSQPDLFTPQNADLRRPVLDPAGNIVQWGNPYTNFVGDVHGSETGKTGYGVYWPVILSIAHSHGAPASVGGEGIAPQTVYAALAARHPVVIWINSGFGTAPAATWRSWDGATIRYTLHEHAVTLTGVSDGQVLVNDPWQGGQYWVSKGAFEGSWAVFGNMAVVVQ